MEPSPAFVRQPEGNGCIERFFRTLKEQLLWIRRFRDLTELRAALMEFRERYNQHWIIQRLTIEHRSRQDVISPLNRSWQHDSMGPLTPTVLSTRSGPIHNFDDKTPRQASSMLHDPRWKVECWSV